jgi:hypothetical protein
VAICFPPFIYESAGRVKGFLRCFSGDFWHKFQHLDTLQADQPEDRATLESDPSAALVAGMAGEPAPRRTLFRSAMKEAILARKR